MQGAPGLADDQRKKLDDHAALIGLNAPRGALAAWCLA
jgi:hypothetical protein